MKEETLTAIMFFIVALVNFIGGAVFMAKITNHVLEIDKLKPSCHCTCTHAMEAEKP